MRLPILFVLMMISTWPAQAATKRIVALGDSLTAGYGLQGGEDFATKLQEALIADGVDVKIDNAGVSGDTTAGGLARLEWATQGDPKPDLVIVALGANDMLRGIEPDEARKNLSSILENLKAKGIPAFLVGMKAPTNMGGDYKKSFEAIYPDLAKKYDVPFYPFFLEGVATRQDLNLPDGIHPNTKGVAIIVEKMTPALIEAIKQD